MKCKHCNGRGVTKKYTNLQETKSGKIWQKTKLCLYCFGDGELDWIEEIVGKNRINAGHEIQIHHSTVWIGDIE